MSDDPGFSPPRWLASLLALFILACAGLYLLGNGSVTLWDRDEPRYAQTSRQMLHSGDWVVPHYLDLVRTAKPVFIYWCQASAMSVFGDNAFAARFPSAVAVVLLLTILAVVLRRMVGADRAALTVFVLGSSTLVVVEAKFCITDAVLLLWVTIAQLSLYALWRGSRSWLVVLAMAVAVGLAGLTKGPVVLGILATTLLILGVMGRGRSFRWPSKQASTQAAVKSAVGLAVTAAIVLPWILMVNHRASQFLRTAVNHEVWDRMMTPLEQHTGPPGYYLLTIWGTFFPWSWFLPMAIGLAIRHRDDPRNRFALAAVVGPWVMLECIRTKLPHYLLPVYPPLAYLVADAIVRCLRHEHEDIRSRAFVIAIGIWALLVAVVCWAPLLAVGRYPQHQPYAAMVVIGFLGAAGGATTFGLFRQRRIVPAVVAMGLSPMLCFTMAYGFYLPRAEFLQISPRVAAVLKQNGVMQPHQVIMLDYMEPSLAFYQGGTIREAGGLGFGPAYLSQLPPWIVTTRQKWDEAVPVMHEQYQVISDTYGLAYADKRHWMHVLVLHRKPAN